MKRLGINQYQCLYTEIVIKIHATSTICLQIVQIGPNGFVCPYCPKISKRRGTVFNSFNGF